jgi:hypothetical protein
MVTPPQKEQAAHAKFYQIAIDRPRGPVPRASEMILYRRDAVCIFVLGDAAEPDRSVANNGLAPRR